MQRTFSGSLAITKLKHNIITVKNKTHGDTRGVFIPIEQNHLVEGKNNAIYLPVRVITHRDPDRFGQHGFIAQTVDSSSWKKADGAQRETFKNLPILGNLKDFETGANDASGKMEDIPSEVIDDSQDLPY